MTILMASYITMVVINNLLTPDINLGYVEHVMSMDGLPSDDQLWRSVNSQTIHFLFFIMVVVMEALAALLCWVGAYRMIREKHYYSGQTIATAGLTVAMIVWFGVFFVAGGEWFLAWQSRWGALAGATRVVTMAGFTLLFINLPEGHSIE